nr:uncharacterized protein LOC107454423 [Parasteatoda tepidariorum]
MEIIRDKIKKILPCMECSVLDTLIKLLVDIGVTVEEELKYVAEADLTPVLRPIQARKLIAAWKQSGMMSYSIRDRREKNCILNFYYQNYKINFFIDVLPPVPISKVSPEKVNTISDTTTEATSTSATSTTPKNSALDWAEEYSIPWQKMSVELTKDLKEGRRPSPANRKEFVNKIAQSIFKICAKPGKKNLSKIARKAIEAYPKSFSDIWCDEVVAGGCESLTRTLVIKFENLNRRDSFSLQKRNLKRERKENPSTSVELSASANYGCLNWQPNVLPIGESPETQKEKQKEMLAISSTMKPSEDANERSLALLEATFYSQRKDINSLKTITDLIGSWPLLFTEKGFFQHFKLLTGVNIPELLKKASESKIPRIINFFKSLSKKKIAIQDILDKFENDETADELCSAICLILEYFNEKKEAIFISVDVSIYHIFFYKNLFLYILVARYPLECNLLLFESQPLQINIFVNIISLLISAQLSGDDFFAKSYMVAIDNKVINEEIKSGSTGLLMVFAAYYILNIEYAEMACGTLEFIQSCRCFLKINPDKGSKASKNKKKKNAVNPKVLSLLNKLMDFEWC